ncbi:MAG TPA: hypothetical protein PLT50_03215 [bacterium]|nr:hypothetical protein [bacterium]
MPKNKDQKFCIYCHPSSGMGLVEVLLAFGVSIIIITALVSLSTFVLRTANTSSRMMQGTRLVNKEVETIRVVRDIFVNDPNLSWEDFYNLVQGCVAVDASGNACPSATSCYVDLNYSNYIRNGSFSVPNENMTVCFGARLVGPAASPDSDKIDIIAVATWTIGGQKKYAHNYTRLTNWNN